MCAGELKEERRKEIIRDGLLIFIHLKIRVGLFPETD